MVKEIVRQLTDDELEEEYMNPVTSHLIFDRATDSPTPINEDIVKDSTNRFFQSLDRAEYPVYPYSEEPVPDILGEVPHDHAA